MGGGGELSPIWCPKSAQNLLTVCRAASTAVMGTRGTMVLSERLHPHMNILCTTVPNQGRWLIHIFTDDDISIFPLIHFAQPRIISVITFLSFHLRPRGPSSFPSSMKRHGSGCNPASNGVSTKLILSNPRGVNPYAYGKRADRKDADPG